jgi:hypothetical protein
MRPLAGAFGAALAALFAASAGAQPLPDDAPPDVPSGPAAIRGQLQHPTRPEAAADVRVVLYALTADGEAGVRQAFSDASGAFAFEGISNDPHTVYLVGARTGEVPYGTRVAFEAGELVQQVELVLSDPTSNATGVAVGEVVLRVVRGCTHLRVRHAHTLRNDGDLVVHVPREARDGREPLIEVELPDDAVGFEASMGSGDGVEREGSLVRFWGPLHPGTQQIEFGYGVPLTHDAGSVQVGLPDGAPAVTVLVPQGDARLTTTSAAIRTDVDVSLDGRLYEVTEFGPVDAAGRVSFDVSLRTPDSPPLQTPAARLWLEVDDAAVDVSEQHQIEVEGTAPLTSPSGAPLLCIPLPADAEDLRFGSDTLEWGLSRDPSGALAVSGPIPPGESQLSMRYRIPVASDPVAFERSFSTRVPLLSIFVEDTGIVPITTRLHRRRPIRSEDRSYLHLEGFAIEPGENVTLRIQQLRRRGATSGLTAAGFVGLAALLAIVFLTGPLRSEPRRAPAPEAAQSVEREAVYRAVEALDEDFETGKLSPDDHARMRAELRAPCSRPSAAGTPRSPTPPRPAPAVAQRCGARIASARSVAHPSRAPGRRAQRTGRERRGHRRARPGETFRARGGTARDRLRGRAGREPGGARPQRGRQVDPATAGGRALPTQRRHAPRRGPARDAPRSTRQGRLRGTRDAPLPHPDGAREPDLRGPAPRRPRARGSRRLTAR